MKSQISSIDLHYLVSEMKIIEGGRLDKIYHPKKEELIMQFHVKEKGKQILRIISGKFAFLSEHKESYDAPSGFCMFLRKNLGNSKLKSIEQVGSERILLLDFGKFRLYSELFGKGNIVFTDDKDFIFNALNQKKWKDRVIKKDEKYDFPRNKYDLFRIKKEEFISLMKSDKELVMKLAKEIGLGGVYSEEIILISGVEKKKVKLDTNETEKVWDAFNSIRKHEVNAKVVLKDNSVQDVVPFELEKYKEYEFKEMTSFNNAFDYFFKEEFGEEFVSRHQANIDKALKIIKQQEKQTNELEKKAGENNRKGELIYEKYQEVDGILKEINKAREKYSFKEIKEKLKGHKIVKEVDEKNKKIAVEL